jgi:GDP/UDP-N,N'-diacetylbacillosamine 2-epimerase (hydrolysing)
MKKKICVVTGSRADYGLLKWLILFLQNDKNIKSSLIVTGAHLSKKYGYTVDAIKKDQIKISSKIDLKIKKTDEISLSNSMAISLNKTTKELIRIKPHIVILLGDRYELLSSAISCMLLNIPIGHIHGGELTEAAFDDSIRHSITKMAHLHFVSNNTYKKRVIQLGENKNNIHVVGGLGLDNFKYIKLLTKKELEKNLKIKFLKKSCLVTFHPVTLEKNSLFQLKQLLDSIKSFKEITFIITSPNADTIGMKMKKLILTYVKKHNNFHFFNSLGQLKYISSINVVDFVLGNSSSGIIEVPELNKYTINVGNRQKGRLMAKSIIQCNPNKKEITKKINLIYKKYIKKKLKNNSKLYGESGASLKIYNILKKTNFENLINKKFYDQ